MAGISVQAPRVLASGRPSPVSPHLHLHLHLAEIFASELIDLAIGPAPRDLRSARNLSQLRQLRSVHLGFDLRLVDPGLGWHQRRVWSVAEPLGVGVVGGGEGGLPVLVDGVGGAEVD